MPGASDPTGEALTPGTSAVALLVPGLANESFLSSYPTVTVSPDATLGLNSDAVYELNVPYATCEVLVAVAAVAGNGLVLDAFRRERRLRRRTNYYIVSLAAADLLVGLLGIPVAVLASVPGGLPSELHACLLAVCLLVVLCTISIFCLVAVSVDRYWAILHPMAYSRNVRTKTAVGIICVCWVAGTFVGFLPLLGWNAGPQERCRFTEVMDYNYLVFLYFATIIVPAVLLAAFYAHIYRVVLRQLRQMVTMDAGPRTNAAGREGSGTMLRMLGAAQRREVKATQNLAIIVLFFILCWIPLYTINCVKAFCPGCPVEGPLTDFCIILSHLNSAVNPLLYAYHLRDFRAALRAVFGGGKRRRMQRHKFLHLNDDGPGIVHAASAPAAIRTNACNRNLKQQQHQKQEMPHVSAAAISSTRCLVAAAGYPEALSPETLRIPLETTPPTPRRAYSPPLQRFISEGGSLFYRRRPPKMPRTSAASCPETEVRFTYLESGDGDEGLRIEESIGMFDVSGVVVLGSGKGEEGEKEEVAVFPDEVEESPAEQSRQPAEQTEQTVVDEMKAEDVEVDAEEDIVGVQEAVVRTISEEVQGKCSGFKESPNGDIPLVESEECAVTW